MQQEDEYKTDSDTERDNKVEFEVVSKTGHRHDQVGKSTTCICWSGFMSSALFDGYISISLTAKIS